MCFVKKVIQQKTVEEIVAEKSAGMTDAEKAQYWYELSQNIFALLGKVEVEKYEIETSVWRDIAYGQYQTLQDVKMADLKYVTTDMDGLQAVLSKDWTNLVAYAPDVSDCDKYAARLYSHLVDYYGLTGIVPVWGWSGDVYHAFNLAVLREGDGWIARLIEPQKDAIFAEAGPLGLYRPQEVARELGVLKGGTDDR